VTAIAKSKTWSATYLLPYAAGPSATPDKKVRGQFRHKEIVTATSDREVVRDLMARQAVPVEVKEVKPTHPLFGGGRVTKDFKQQFLLSLTFSVDGGMSPGRALEQAIESQTGPMRQRLNPALDALRQGRSFLDALRLVNIYDQTTMAIIEAGEETGTLRQSLATAEANLKKGSDARKTIIGALAWTGIDLFFAVGSIISTRTGLIPYLREQNANASKDAVAMNHALDIATSFNDVLLVTTALALIALFAGAYGYFGSNEAFRLKVDAWLLRVPIVRDLMVHTAISGTCGVMASLLKGGVNFIPATQISERGTRMMTVVRYWSSARGRVEMGETPAAATSQEPFTSTERLILAAHRDSGQLAKAYDVIGTTRDELSKSSAKKFARVTFLVTMGYSMLGVLLVLYVVFLQNQSTMNMSFSGG
jgi:general secretion pathway protein F